MSFYKKRTFLIIILFSLSSCVKGAFSYPESWNMPWWHARPYMAKGLPDDDGDYTKGFKDGCLSSFSMVAQGGVRNSAPKYDGWKLTTNRMYASGFLDGEEHCTYIYDWDIT